MQPYTNNLKDLYFQHILKFKGRYFFKDFDHERISFDGPPNAGWPWKLTEQNTPDCSNTISIRVQGNISRRSIRRIIGEFPCCQRIELFAYVEESFYYGEIRDAISWWNFLDR